ncbi:MAG: hypothetical protein NTU53_20150 [Planctomycetota bacterium]|nr:hypothetical protein [Planctomycetota bacterium]
MLANNNPEQPGDEPTRLEKYRRQRMKIVNLEEVMAELERIAAAPEVEAWQSERWDGMS